MSDRQSHPSPESSASNVSTDQESVAKESSAEPCLTGELVLVENSNLRSLRARPRFGEYLRQLWERRHFIFAEARSKALNSGRGTFLGKAWILINPLLQVAVFIVIFGLILKVDRGLDNFVGFLILGVIFFGFITGGLSTGSGLIKSSRNMITSFHFPRASLGFSATTRAFIDNLAPALMAVLLAVFTQLDKPVHWTIIFVVPLYLLIHLFNLGTTLVVARMTAFIPDTKALVSLLNRALFFLSGVFFPLSRFDTYPALQVVMEANPVYQFLTAVRLSVLDGVVPPLEMWLYLTVWSVGVAAFGLVFFWRAEARYSGVR